MNRYLIILIFIAVSAGGCKKKDNPRLSGTDTIDNNLYGAGPYYAYGFSFSRAEKVSTLDDPGPDITLLAFDINGIVTKIQTDNFQSSFYKAGEYPDASSAEQAFDNLTSPIVSQWVEEADAIGANQIWIFRTSKEKYAKFRIIDTFSEMRSGWAYGECTFEWVYQPDGSLTFPVK
jgi:hypothetical protein